MLQPCCCTSVQKGVEIVAVFSLIWTCALIAEETILVAVYGCEGLQKIQQQNLEFGSLTGKVPLLEIPLNKSIGNAKQAEVQLAVNTKDIVHKKTMAGAHSDALNCSMTKAGIAVACGWITSWVFNVILAIVLIHGVQVKSIKLCSIWFNIRFTILFFRVTFLFIYFISGLPLVPKIPVILLIIFWLYSLWVVSSFVDELKSKRAKAESTQQS